MNTLDKALELAAQGFHVFPLEPNGKLPAIKDYPNRATRDPEKIMAWFSGRNRNIGISTSRFAEDKALVVVDVDNKGEKRGEDRLLELELDGLDFPVSFEQSTPTGGRHIVYVTDRPLKQGVDVLGAGLDIRSKGGYIVGPGSAIDGKTYAQINGHSVLEAAPDWLVERLGSALDRGSIGIDLTGVDPDRAIDRATHYLVNAPVAIEGEGGDLTTYKVAAKLKDLGCTPDQAIDLLLEHWNPQCIPPWDAEELEAKVYHAFKYGKEPAGISAPEAVFDPVQPPAAGDEAKHPVDALNDEYAFIKAGAFILQETTDHNGRFATLRLSPNDMHSWFANKTMDVNGKQVPLSKLWMSRTSRREYEGVVFSPARQVDARFYNLWRGFSVEPAATGSHPAVDMFLEHALNNVCNGDKNLCHWLLGFFAHMIQRPWEKPLVALVFKGDKGTGKNALVERVGHLLGGHFMVADDDRYLLGNFNSHLENNLFFVLDEAAWAGDKRAEGRLKGLITGTHHVIERKGAEPYKVDNLLRVAIIGNEDWLVPATSEERRFAVFDVGTGRQQDRKFFEGMRVGMEKGGYAHLLRFLLDYDFSDIDINSAPNTKALAEQKMASLEPLEQWWLDCLANGQILGADFGAEWPLEMNKERFRAALDRYCKERSIRRWSPNSVAIGRSLHKIAPGVVSKRARRDETLCYIYTFPDLAEARREWENYIKSEIDWEKL